MKAISTLILTAALLCGRASAETAQTTVEVTADPASIRLSGPTARHSILVTGKMASGRMYDLTRTAIFRSADERVALVDMMGVVRPVADGSTTLTVSAAGKTLSIPVTVEHSSTTRVFRFEHDVVPVLSKFGCNSSACHGKAEGQNGFKLSVFGFDPNADFDALTKEARGRRIFPAAPERSLLLTKATGVLPHGGGIRIRPDSDEYRTLVGWIAAGMPFGEADAPRVVAVRCEPKERTMEMNAAQRLRVIARWSDGREADVTAHARFQSNNDNVARVGDTGLVTAGDSPGQAAIMAGYMGAFDTFQAFVPRPGKAEELSDLPRRNFVDGLVYERLKKLNIRPSGDADDAEFLRRVHLDVIGTLPTADEARAFLSDKRPDRRAKLVDELLKRPEFADYWALKWADVLRVDRAVLGHKRAYGYYKWIRDALAAGKPMDAFAREIVTAEGPLNDGGPANFYKAVTRPGDMAASLSQVFLGVRISCAECHHHPFDRWSQTDYYGMQAYFAPLAVRPGLRGETLMASTVPPTKHPRTGEMVFAHPLGGDAPAADLPPSDRRAALANWLTAPDNPWFARTMSNRVWAHLMGRGIIEPVDDVRATNPPTNPELLDALGRHFVESKYDLRTLIRTITASQTYQMSSAPNDTNGRDVGNHSRAALRKIDAEVLLDMVCQTTGIGEKFQWMPAGIRAIQLWDSKSDHYFLKAFGRPVRATACECERNVEPNVPQVLHLLNSPEIHAKLIHESGAVAKLTGRIADDRKLVEELYLSFFSRFPTDTETAAAAEFLGKDPAKRRKAAEDLAWSLMNSLEFVFNH